MKWLELYAVVVIFIGALALALTLVTYARHDWRATASGRAIMTLVLALCALYFMSVAVVIFGGFPGLEYLQAAVYTFDTVALLRLLVTMWRRNRQH